MKIDLSSIDQQRFGIVTAKATLAAGDVATAALAWTTQHDARLLIVRCDTQALAQVQELEQAGAYLTDTLVYYAKSPLVSQEVALPDAYCWRLATAADGTRVEALAARTFQGYMGHYHADPRLAPADADLVYSSWAGNSCRDTRVADAVVLIEHGTDIVAFATLQRRGPDEVEGILFGVHPAHQGLRLYQALMQLAQQWGLAAGVTRMLVSTQVTNLAVQKVWCRQGFEPCSSAYTLHYWR